ncbi:peptidylprolyl isomerase [Usitatibacter palustris]|uniref:peptidylprolyl isomerase n=1 Tax=Usitatibacter palustris TaxID=2732487 RepID=A0A6M4HCK7_9PROT|nr:peptidylprolyl isomerase [Usitatibacter palustris]QJR16468.1 Foldase protein PrsA [Usitatibacter palustris]
MRILTALLVMGLPLCALGAPDTPLITNPPVVVTEEDFEAFLLRVPPLYRPEVRASLERIGKAVDQVYANRIIAGEARKMGLDKDPLVQLRIKQLEEAYLATLWGDVARKNVKVPDFTKRAEDLYRVNKARYTEPERFTGEQLLISFNGRTRESALEYARSIRARAVAGDDFKSLVSSFSEDPMVRRNGGKLEGVAPTDLEKPLSDAAFALKKRGDISEPIESKSGFHIIRMESKAAGFLRPFADVKADIIEEEESKFRDTEAEKEAGRLKNTPQTVVHTKNIEAIRKDLDQAEITRLHREAGKAGDKAAKEGAR